MAPRILRHFKIWTAAVIAAAFPLGAGENAAPEPTEVEVAIIVHEHSKVPDPSLKELRAYISLERQFWPQGMRIQLLQRPTKSPEGKVLLQKVYQMTEEELRRHWVQKLFVGEIPAIPSIVRSTESAATAVLKNEGAITAVLASSVPKGVRVLRIDGKRPGEQGYPLTGTISD